MSIRSIVKKIIKEESEGYQMDFGNPEKARLGIISLSKGLIKNDNIKLLKGDLSGADFDDSGFTSSDGDVEIIYDFEGDVYNTILGVTGEFYLINGKSGHYGASIDDSRAPEPDTSEDENIILNDNQILIGDNDQNEYDFTIEQLGPTFKKDMEGFLLEFYNPMAEVVQKK